MAVLSDDERKAIWAEAMQPGGVGATGTLLKADLRATVDAIDSFCEAQATAFNQAIPQPARGVLTAKQKAAFFMLVVGRRHKVL